MSNLPAVIAMTDAPQLPPQADLAAELDRLELAVTPAELHGSLCGYLSGGGKHDRQHWLAQVMSETIAAPDEGSALDRLYRTSLRQLESPDFDFELLLPDEDSPVSQRGDALLSWCRSFLGGFGLASGPQQALSDESADALKDLSRIAASDLSYEDPEADEEALQEVVEFVRVTALLLHSDCVLGPRHRRTLN